MFMTTPDVQVVTVDPTLANTWLQKNIRNRALNKRVVARYARAMKNDQWQFNGDAIRFDQNGTLIDGQHRLAACIQADMSFQAVVIKNLPTEAQDAIDVGRMRRAGDQFAIHGNRNATLLAAATRILWAYDQGVLPTHNGTIDVTYTELLDYADKHQELNEITTLVVSRRKHLPVTASVYVAALVLMMRVDSDSAMSFHNSFSTGSDLSEGNPILILRERFQQNRTRNEQYSNYELMSALLRCWNAWRRGEHWKAGKVPLFRSQGKPYPIPVPV